MRRIVKKLIQTPLPLSQNHQDYQDYQQYYDNHNLNQEAELSENLSTQNQSDDNGSEMLTPMNMIGEYLNQDIFADQNNLSDDQNKPSIGSINLIELNEKVIYQIDQYLCLGDKLNLRGVCKVFEALFVIDIYPVDNEIMKRINEQTLRQWKYKNLSTLIIQGLCSGFDLNFLSQLKMLNIQGSGFQDSDIDKLNLRGINLSYNQYITNLNHITDLQLLVACGNCGIHDQGIKDLINLEIVNVSNNNKITKICYPDKLKVLIARFESGINDESIQGMNLEALDVSHNNKVSQIGHMQKLRSLSAAGNCGINDDSIKTCDLEKLDASNNKMITKIEHMTRLKILIARGNSGINDQSIKSMDLEELDIMDNQSVTDVKHMKKLRILRTKNLKLLVWWKKKNRKTIG